MLQNGGFLRWEGPEDRDTVLLGCAFLLPPGVVQLCFRAASPLFSVFGLDVALATTSSESSEVSRSGVSNAKETATPEWFPKLWLL